MLPDWIVLGMIFILAAACFGLGWWAREAEQLRRDWRTGMPPWPDGMLLDPPPDRPVGVALNSAKKGEECNVLLWPADRTADRHGEMFTVIPPERDEHVRIERYRPRSPDRYGKRVPEDY